MQKIMCSMRVLIAHARVPPNEGCNKPFYPRELGSDLNSVVRTDCMCRDVIFQEIS